jgi:hypothetical protein
MLGDAHSHSNRLTVNKVVPAICASSSQERSTGAESKELQIPQSDAAKLGPGGVEHVRWRTRALAPPTFAYAASGGAPSCAAKQEPCAQRVELRKLPSQCTAALQSVDCQRMRASRTIPQPISNVARTRHLKDHKFPGRAMTNGLRMTGRQQRHRAHCIALDDDAVILAKEPFPADAIYLAAL